MAALAARHRALVLVSIAFVLIAAACSSSSTSSSSPVPPMASNAPAAGHGSVTLVAGAGGQNVFSPSTFSVKQGGTVTVKNAGSTAHTFTVTGQSIDVTIQPGQSQQVKVNLAPGTYPFVCTIHQSLGMTGTMTVT